ncbi:MAG: hypothetical protein QM775_10970 [Pirellulales bacterium]
MYAKMLIAIMVMDGDPLAVEFIVQRGYKESDLQKPEASALLLRKWMMQKAEQGAPEDGPETRGQANVEAVFGKTPANVLNMMSAVKSKAQELYADAKTKTKGHPYDPSWKGPAALLSEQSWKTVKADAVKKGLFPESTGIGETLGKLEKLLANLGVQTLSSQGVKEKIKATSGAKLKTGEQPPALRQRAPVLAAVNAALEAEAIIAAYQPMHVPMSKDGTKIDLSGKVDFHAGMIAYLKDLRSNAASVAGVLENLTQGISRELTLADYDQNGDLKPGVAQSGWIADGEQRDMTWKHATTDVKLEAVVWTSATDVALKKAWMDKDGEGDATILKLRDAVTSSLTKYQTASAKTADLSKVGGQEARKLRQAAYDALQVVIDALKSYWKDCGHNGIRDYCNALMSTSGTVIHKLDLEIYPDAPPSYEERVAAYGIAALKLPDENERKVMLSRIEKLKKTLDKDPADIIEQTLDKIYEDLKKDLKSDKVAEDVVKSIDPPAGTFSLKAVKGKPKAEHFSHVVWEKAREECVVAGFMDADTKANAVFGALKTWSERNTSYLELVEIVSDSGGVEVHRVKVEKGATSDQQAKRHKEAQKQRFEVRKALTEVFLAAGEVAASVHTPAMSDYVIFIIKHSQRLNFEALETQRKVDFKPKIEFSKDGWKTSYEAAVSSGAIAPHDGRAKALSKAFGKFDEKFKSTKAKIKSDDRKEARLEARRAQKLLSEVGIAVDGVARAEGYCDNQRMSDLIDYYSNEILKLQTEGELVDLMEGAGKNFPATEFRWDNDDWQKVKKVAIKDGILDDEKTGFGKSLDVSEKSWSSLMVAQEGNVQPQALAKMRIRTLAALDEVEREAKVLQGVKNPNFQKYMDSCLKILESRREALDDKGEFPAFSFRLENKHWQTVKKTAVTLHLMADVKTGFGATIDRVSDIHDAYDAASKAYAKGQKVEDKEDMDELRDPLKEAADLCKKAAEKLSTTVDNADFQRYMSECVAMMGQITDYADGKQAAVLKLPPFKFDKELWESARKEAVDAGVFEDKPTNLSKAVEDGLKAYGTWINETDSNKDAANTKTLKEAIQAVKTAVGKAAGFAKHDSVKLFVERFQETVEQWEEELNEFEDDSTTGTNAPQTSTPQDPAVAEWLPKNFTKTTLITESEWKETVKEAKKHGWNVTGLPIRKGFKAVDKARAAYLNDTDKDKKNSKNEFRTTLQNLVTNLEKLEKEACFDKKWDKAKGPHPGMQQFASRLVLKAKEELGSVKK